MVAVSCTQEKVDVSRLVKNYAVVTIPAPDLTGITDNGKEVLKLYRMAADEVNNIYWQQNFVVMAISRPEPVSIRRI